MIILILLLTWLNPKVNYNLKPSEFSHYLFSFPNREIPYRCCIDPPMDKIFEEFKQGKFATSTH